MTRKFRGVHTRKTRIIGLSLESTLVHKHNSPSLPFSVTHPKIAAQWHQRKNGPWKPEDFTYGSQVKAWWRCSKSPDHIWKASFNSRSSGCGCPFCAGHSISVTNALTSLFPDIAKEWHPIKNGKLTSKQVVAHSSKRVWWQCCRDAAHEWQAVINDRTGKLSRCPFCAGDRAGPNNNLRILYPKIASQWHPTRNGKLKPTQVTGKANRIVWWKCSIAHDHIWRASIANRTNNKSGCPFCSGSKPSSTNSLKTLYPRIAAEWHPTRNGKFTPLEVTYGSNFKAWFCCARNSRHVWQAAIKSRTTRNTGCPICAMARLNMVS